MLLFVEHFSFNELLIRKKGKKTIIFLKINILIHTLRGIKKTDGTVMSIYLNVEDTQVYGGRFFLSYFKNLPFDLFTFQIILLQNV